MRVLQFQGQLFVASALLVTLAGVLFGRLEQETELALAAGFILLLGVPHGALDVDYLRGVFRPQSVASWVAFAALYLLIAALVVCFWRLSPALFLGVFLLVSAAHFSADPASGTAWLVRALYGGVIILLPTLRYGTEVQAIFATLIGSEPARELQVLLRWLAWPWLLGLVVMIVRLWRRERTTAVEVSALTLLATLAPPLVAFTVYFCAMHSPRHILRTGRHFEHSPQALLRIALLPMAGVFALLWLAWPAVADLTGSTRWTGNVLTLVFVGLAALTVPHMLLVERIRFTARSSIW